MQPSDPILGLQFRKQPVSYYEKNSCLEQYISTQEGETRELFTHSSLESHETISPAQVENIAMFG